VPHTFAIFECVGDQESSDPRLADAERGGKRLYVDRLPLIPKAGMSGARGHPHPNDYLSRLPTSRMGI